MIKFAPGHQRTGLDLPSHPHPIWMCSVSLRLNYYEGITPSMGRHLTLFCSPVPLSRLLNLSASVSMSVKKEMKILKYNWSSHSLLEFVWKPGEGSYPFKAQNGKETGFPGIGSSAHHVHYWTDSPNAYCEYFAKYRICRGETLALGETGITSQSEGRAWGSVEGRRRSQQRRKVVWSEEGPSRQGEQLLQRWRLGENTLLSR